MAGSKSDAFENALLDWLLGGVALVPAASVYVGLWTATLSDSSTGATAGEVSGGGYARVAVTRNQTNFPASSGGAIANGAAINFGTASADWGTVVSMAILSASSGGTIFYWIDVSPSKIIQNGDPVQINIGDLDVSET